MIPLSARRFLFITGKGGTGKSTVTAALAMAMASRGRRVLVTVTEPKERISTLLGVRPFDETVREVASNIWAVRIGPEAAMREYGEMILKSATVSKAVFENRYVRTFFAAVPGLYPWAMLGKAWFHATEERADGSPRFHTVLFDAPATGHGLEMLRVPKVIVEVVPPGILRRDAERAWRMFQNPAESGVMILSLPEDMPANEAIELAGAVREELGLPIARLVVNAVVEELFTEVERRRLFDVDDLVPSDPGDEGLSAAARRAVSEEVQRWSLDKLERTLGLPTTQLPRLLSEVSGPEDVRKLADVLAAEV